MSRRRRLFASVALASLAIAARAHAQSGPLTLRPASADSARIDAGTVLTTVFTVRNAGRDTVLAVPTVTVPKGWTVVMGGAPLSVAPGITDTWLVGVSVPASAAAQRYVMNGKLTAGDASVSDSIVVQVNERRALEVLSIDMPGWVMAGSRYESRFIVRNRGNVASTISLTGATSRGTRVETVPSTMSLAPGASALVTVRVAIANTFERSTDDVLEVTAVDPSDRSTRVSASTRTTVVSSEESSRFATIPAMLSLRSIGTASGVSPVALSGSSLLADRKTNVDFLLQAPAGRQTQFGFGERDEYRANFKNANWSLKLGDNLYGFSDLTSSGMLGTGAGFAGTLGNFSAGLYAQHPRWVPGESAEEGMFVGTKPDSLRQLSTTFVERQTQNGAVSVGSVGGRLRLFPGATLELETATSDSNHATGLAERARMSGTLRGVNYQFGILNGNSSFAGLARGTMIEDGSFSARVAGKLTIGASGSVRVSNFATPLDGVPAQRFSTASVNASYGGVATVEYGFLSRHDDGVLTQVDGTQHGVRATTSLPVGPASFSLSYERGVINATLDSSSRPYSVVSISAQTKLWHAGTFSVFGSHNDGSTLTGQSSGVADAGVSLDLHLPFNLELQLSTSAQRATLGVFDGSGSWYSESDARLDYRFAGGQSLSLRERIWQNPGIAGSAGSANANAIYLEFRTPIRLPVGPSHSAGRAEGIIVDANTGKPVVGALVRLADQAAVTDKDGRVRFSGLEPDRHRVSIEATGAAAGALLVGDAFVETSATATQPAKFSLAVARGGTVRALVRRLDAANGTLSTSGDSLVTVSMEPNVLVALQSGRDTIYQSSDDRGRLDFGAVAPGKWTLVVMPGDLPDHHVFESDRVEVTVNPGSRSDIELRLVPQRRMVTFIGPESISLRAVPKP